MKLFPNFSKKFIPFLNSKFSLSLPSNFNAFKNMKGFELAGTYKPKFDVFENRESDQQVDMKNLSRSATSEKLDALSKQLKREKDEKKKERLLIEIGNYAEHAKKNGWINENQLRNFLSSPDDEPSDDNVMSLIEEETRYK